MILYILQVVNLQWIYIFYSLQQSPTVIFIKINLKTILEITHGICCHTFILFTKKKQE